MFDVQALPHSLELMGFRASFVVNSWAASVTVPVEYDAILRQTIDAVASTFPQFRVSGYFFRDLKTQGGLITYQLNRVPGPTIEVLSDQALDFQLAALEEQLNRHGAPYEMHRFSLPPQDERNYILFGLGKGFSGVHFSGEQVWEVLQRHREEQGECQQVQIYAVGGGEAVYEEPALLIPCRDEEDLHWVCMALLVFWQEWALVYDTQRSVAFRLVTTLGEVRETLYPARSSSSL